MKFLNVTVAGALALAIITVMALAIMPMALGAAFADSG